MARPRNERTGGGRFDYQHGRIRLDAVGGVSAPGPVNNASTAMQRGAALKRAAAANPSHSNTKHRTNNGQIRHSGGTHKAFPNKRRGDGGRWYRHVPHYPQETVSRSHGPTVRMALNVLRYAAGRAPPGATRPVAPPLSRPWKLRVSHVQFITHCGPACHVRSCPEPLRPLRAASSGNTAPSVTSAPR